MEGGCLYARLIFSQHYEQAQYLDAWEDDKSSVMKGGKNLAILYCLFVLGRSHHGGHCAIAEKIICM